MNAHLRRKRIRALKRSGMSAALAKQRRMDAQRLKRAELFERTGIRAKPWIVRVQAELLQAELDRTPGLDLFDE